ncbi:hypothetical protein GEOBRER4_n1990 [Citrifermentans bremense]|uniref:DUF2971 domain-containing protein n=1 Tax=Citrifermentans bremense TaxID=60035 RepID=A0A6S6M6Z2_9BACT|nr:DUF2971 domain-containing protein [Citrifermentans bremense]BCG47165.1 hypothetical protein GEOBRER4_n1990 [Citrifermentans bremense]
MELYRYSRLSDNIIKYLRDRKLYFQNPLYFNDPFDCDLTAVSLGPEDNFDEKYELYIQLLAKRLKFVAGKLRLIDARITDYASDDTPIKDRFYFAEQWHLYLTENNALLAEIRMLTECPTSKRRETLLEAWNKKKNQVIHGLGVVCFSESNSNLLMWSHYADSHKGICLIYESEERPVVGWKQYSFHKVKYNKNRNIDVLSVGFEKAFFDLLTIKSPEWEYEKEQRLITIKGPGTQKSRMASLRGIVFGSRIKDNPGTSLVGLYGALKDMHQTRPNCPRFRYYKAVKHPSDFAVEIKELFGIQAVPDALGVVPFT